MKIIIFGNSADSIVNFRGDLIRELIDQGHQVLAFAPETSELLKQKINNIGARFVPIYVERTGVNPLKDIKTVVDLIGLLKKEKPDIILSYTIKSVIYGSIAAGLSGIKKIYSMITGLGYAFSDSDNSLKQKVVYFAVRFLYKQSLRFNRKIFFQNPDDRNLFIQLHLIKDINQAVLINGSGVNIDRFVPAKLPEKISFLLIARLLKDKGVGEYAAAAHIIKRKYPDIIFKLVGWRYDNPTVISKEKLQSWIDEGIIEYLGRLDDVRPVIAESSVYVLPSYYREGTPRTILEAMAIGRPVITTDVPGCRETVIDGKNGFLVPARDIDKLTEAMERFISNPVLIKTMGNESRKIAEEKYDVRKVNQKIMTTMGLA